MIPRVSSKLLNFRKLFSPSVWTARLVGAFRMKSRESGPGLIMVQIDALGFEQVTRALHDANLPFLGSLIGHEDYRLHHHYSGLPSTTPAVQGELHYGVKSAVPSFGFRDSGNGRLTSMLNPATARKVQARLSEEGDSLLRDGSSYSNVYSSEAVRSAFCFTKYGFRNLLKRLHPLEFAVVVTLNAAMFVRAAILVAIELILAVVDFARGLIQGRDILRELQFVPSRAALCVLLREMTTTAAMIDCIVGRKIIHLNYIGYDEQAHRRGPSSRFAHWTLRGIDDSIRRLWGVAHNTAPRDYDLWVFSDHGQEEVIPYERFYKKKLPEEIQRVVDQHLGSHRDPIQIASRSVQQQRAELLRSRESLDITGITAPDVMSLSGYGPIGHLYLHLNEDEEHKHDIASALVNEVGIPLVLYKKSTSQLWAQTSSGRYVLPDQVAQVLGANHPFLLEAARDIIPMVLHPDAGDFVLSGWAPDGQSITFPKENGAHGGPGWRETHGFAMLPSATQIDLANGYIRPLDLRNAAIQLLHGNNSQPAQKKGESQAPLRAMTYNLHSCLGFDGRWEPERHAQIIGQYQPDIIALQEVDVGRRRSGGHHQAQRIASVLDMDYHFHSCTTVEEEHYGIAVISRYPMRIVKAEALPRASKMEARGAMWVEIDRNGERIQVINTHLSLVPRERLLQAQTLMGGKWIGSAKATHTPVVLCGDFNMFPRSKVYQTVQQGLNDAGIRALRQGEIRTWLGVARLDYIFVSEGIEIDHAFTPRTFLTRKASDHTPLVVDMRTQQVSGKERRKWISGNGSRSHSAPLSH